DARRAQSLLARDGLDAQRGSAGIRRAEIADDANVLREATRQHRREKAVERRIVAAVRIATPFELRERQGALCQSLEHQEARTVGPRQRVDQGPRGISAVSGKTGGTTDVGFGGHSSQSSIRTMAGSFYWRSTSEVFTLRTFCDSGQ